MKPVIRSQAFYVSPAGKTLEWMSNVLEEAGTQAGIPGCRPDLRLAVMWHAAADLDLNLTRSAGV